MVLQPLTVIAVFIIGLAFSACPAPADQYADALKAEMSPKIPAIEQIYADIRTGIQQLDRDTFESDAVVEQVGRDPEKLAAWVRDQTRPLPYRGALRGASGVLMERAGNSADRSLLLAEMLQSVGYEVRLANAKLSADQADAVLKQIEARATSPSSTNPPPIVQQTRARIDVIRDHLLKELGAPPADQTDAAERARLLDALSDYWWVQARIGGKWVDYHLAQPANLKPAKTVDFRVRNGVLPLAPADCHEIDLKIVIESFTGGRLKNDTVLQHTFRAAELLGHTLRVIHFAGGLPIGDVTQADAPAVKMIRDALQKQDGFVPALRVDDRVYSSASFTTSGQIDPNPTLDPTGKLASGTGKNGGALTGGLFGGGASAASDGVLTSEWIEYQIRSPGKKPVVIRREIFDLIGPAARSKGLQKAPQFSDDQKLARALQILGSTSILVAPCEISPESIAFRQARAEVAREPIWLGLAHGDYDSLVKIRRALMKAATPDATPENFAIISRGLSSTQGATFIDAPNIVHHQRWFELDSKGVFVRASRMDLAYTSCATIGRKAFEANLARGIADTLAEDLVFGRRAVASRNAATAYEARIASGEKSTLIRPAADGQKQLDALGMPPDVLVRAKADLSAGNTLLLASDSKKNWTWWRVDPNSGQTVGLIDSGFNGAMEERAKLETEIDIIAEQWGEDFTASDIEATQTPEELAKWTKGMSSRLDYLKARRADLILNRAALNAMKQIRFGFIR